MSRGESNQGRLSRLLWRKQHLTRIRSQGVSRRPLTPDVESDFRVVPASCLNCGYDLRAQVVDRCPECGLLLALGYRDPTAWTTAGPGVRTWCRTWLDVCGWGRRTRIRTSLVPTTPATRRFALWCMLLTAGLWGLASGIAGAARAYSPVSGVGLFLLYLLIAGGLVLALLAGALYGVAVTLTGQWRQFRFVPAAVHYACAWGPPTAAVMLLFSALSTATGHPVFETAMCVVVCAGFTLWGIWLWASVTEAGRHTWTGLRIASLTVSLATVVCCALAFGPRSLQGARAALVAATTRVRSGDTLTALVRSKVEPRTRALIADAIPGGDYLVRGRLARLGCPWEEQIVLRHENCTLERLQDELAELRSTLHSHDRLVLYLRGHGASAGAGSIQLEHGHLTSQMLADCLAEMPTKSTLVIISSCYGGKFIRALRGTTDAVVITGTDTQNVGFSPALHPFWCCLTDSRCDVDRDGKVTIEEAFWHAYRAMLAEGERFRKYWVTQSDDPGLADVCAKKGYATPQLAVLGEADPQVFAVTVEPAVGEADADP